LRLEEKARPLRLAEKWGFIVVILMAARPPEDLLSVVILMAAKPPEDLLLCDALTTDKQVLRSLRSHQDDRGVCDRHISPSSLPDRHAMSVIAAPVWEPRLVLTPLTSDLEADVCVIGLGGSGLACIHQLLGSGQRVIGLDASGVAGGAAGRNGGFLLGGLAMFHHEAGAQLGLATAKAVYEQTLMEIDRMERETPEAIRRTGSLRIAVSAEELDDCDAQLGAMREDNLPVEPYEGPEGKGLLFPADAAFDPGARCGGLAIEALRRGVQLFGNSRVVSIDDTVVSTTHGSVRARNVIVAVDGRLETILPELGSRVRSARLQMVATAPMAPTFTRPVYARWGYDYWQQRADGRVVLGGARDIGGEAEWTTSTETSEPVQNALSALLRTIGIEAPITHRWAATVGYTRTGIPILEQVRPRVWAIGAYSGTGNVIGALCGRAVADLVLGQRSEFADLLRV
jgi:gamma-glutamylputrescine oxidase